MFDLLPTLAVRRPVLTTMMVFAALVMGIFSLSRLNTDLFPEVEFPIVTASIVYPGAGPQEIDALVGTVVRVADGTGEDDDRQ